MLAAVVAAAISGASSFTLQAGALRRNFVEGKLLVSFQGGRGHGALASRKKTDMGNGEPDEKLTPFKLILAYATPWRNPNSIFVYFFLAIYLIDALGLGPTAHQ